MVTVYYIVCAVIILCIFISKVRKGDPSGQQKSDRMDKNDPEI